MVFVVTLVTNSFTTLLHCQALPSMYVILNKCNIIYVILSSLNKKMTVTMTDDINVMDLRVDSLAGSIE